MAAVSTNFSKMKKELDVVLFDSEKYEIQLICKGRDKNW